MTMASETIAAIQEYLLALRGRAAEAQAEAKRTLNPLFEKGEGQPPGDFVESSFLYMRACDGDNGSRPATCPLFWLSPDVRVAPLSNLGVPTRQLTAGATYRVTATVRNRGDLPVPSAKVEFFVVDPTLGFDTRFATKIGVAAGRVHAHGAADVALDWRVPPALSGHRCLFARVFSFSPLDIPIDDFALNPVLDRHVAQLNLDIVGQTSSFVVDWVHLRTADERFEIVPMAAEAVRALRFETVTALALVDAERWSKVQGDVRFDVETEPGLDVDVRPADIGLALTAHDPDAPSIEEQLRITKRVLAALKALETGRGDHGELRVACRELRAMNRHVARTRVTVHLPDVGLARDEAVALNVVRRSLATGEATGGIALFVTGDGLERPSAG
jgi:hypothetical protein